MHLFTTFLDTGHCQTVPCWDTCHPPLWGEHTKDKEQLFNRQQVVLTLQVGCDFLTQLNTYRQNWRHGKKARRCLSERGGHSNTDQLPRAMFLHIQESLSKKPPRGNALFPQSSSLPLRKNINTNWLRQSRGRGPSWQAG